ncbi:hypothetical protein [Streptomyces sp. NPDC015125]|uniref:hypothetical protein n=1 Tax=Streptomyces sp. NPDC015125 TaxID=3364938 RepID=UPI0036FC46C4
MTAVPADRRRTVATIADHARTQAREARSRDAEPTLRQLLPALPDADADAVIAALRTLNGALGEAAPGLSGAADL